MKIVVCIKQVPERDARLRIAPDGKSVDTAGAATEINESDQYALEAGLRLAEGAGGEVVALLLGPDGAEEAIRRALAMGATRAIHLNDAAFQEGDASANARALAAAAGAESPDLILTGLQSDDQGFGQVGVLLAEHLGAPHATIVMEVQVADRQVRVKRELEGGWFQWLTMPLPAVLTIQSGINQLRYATLKGIMAARKKDIRIVTAPAAPAPLQRVLALAVPERARKVQLIGGSPAEAAKQLVRKLREDRAI